MITYNVETHFHTTKIRRTLAGKLTCIIVVALIGHVPMSGSESCHRDGKYWITSYPNADGLKHNPRNKIR